MLPIKDVWIINNNNNSKKKINYELFILNLSDLMN